MIQLVNDLRFAMSVDRPVHLTLVSGHRMEWKSVIDVEVNEGFVKLRDPQHFGDTVTFQRLRLGDIAAVTVLAA